MSDDTVPPVVGWSQRLRRSHARHEPTLPQQYPTWEQEFEDGIAPALRTKPQARANVGHARLKGR